MSGTFNRARVSRTRGGLGTTAACLLLFILAIEWAGGASKAQPQAPMQPQAQVPHTTLVIFADHRMEDRQWTALLGALRRAQAEAAMGTPAIAGAFDVVRGDAVKPGMRVDLAITVYLHGDCELLPRSTRTAFGVRLGWVVREHGLIEPFAHVDCTQIGQVLGLRVQGLNRDRRLAIMAGAMARVILHEWIHVATQSKVHDEHGIAKAQFGVADLMSDGGDLPAWLRNPG